MDKGGKEPPATPTPNTVSYYVCNASAIDATKTDAVRVATSNAFQIATHTTPAHVSLFTRAHSRRHRCDALRWSDGWGDDRRARVRLHYIFLTLCRRRSASATSSTTTTPVDERRIYSFAHTLAWLPGGLGDCVCGGRLCIFWHSWAFEYTCVCVCV